MTFIGWTGPAAAVTAFADGTQAGSSAAASNGTFSVVAQRTGTYTARLVSTDTAGRTAAIERSVNLYAGGAIPNILMPPAASVPATVKPGDTISVTGSAVPGATIGLVYTPPTGSPVPTDTSAGVDGSWSANFTTAPVVEGAYSVAVTGAFSGQSASVTLTGTISKTATVTPPPPPPPVPGTCANSADLNCDNHTNLQDVSIMLAFFNKSSFPAAYDLNHDGKLNLVDFSILLYNWKR